MIAKNSLLIIVSEERTRSILIVNYAKVAITVIVVLISDNER